MPEKNNEIISQINAISAQTRIGRQESDCSFEIAKNTFEKIEKLKPDIFSASDYLVRDRNLSIVLTVIGEPAIPYLEHAIRNSKYDNEEGCHPAIYILEKIGEPSVKALSSVFLDYHINISGKSAAASALIKISDKGEEVVRSGLSSQDEDTRYGAVNGFAWVIEQASNSGKFDDTHVNYINLLIPLLHDNNAEIRNRVLRLFITIKLEHNSTRISFQAVSDEELIQLIDIALDDESIRVRETALQGLMSKRTHPSFAPILVKVLEDPSGRISKQAVKLLFSANYPGPVEAEAIVDAIIEELIVRASGQPSENFNPEIVANALTNSIDENPRLHGQIIEKLCELAYGGKEDIRRRSVFVAIRINEGEFRALVNERAKDDPSSAKAIYRILGSEADIKSIANQISETAPGDIQQNAANQTLLLTRYHEDGLKQANMSFFTALFFITVALGCLIAALYFLLFTNEPNPEGLLAAISSIFIEFIAGTKLYLYNQTRKQLTYYHEQMNQTQRILLANSLIESLGSESRDAARRELVMMIASMKNIDIRSNKQP